MIAEGDCAADHMLRIPMTRYQSEHTLFAPLENIRMKKQGGGMNFVHGGISLQEMVVPVIDFQNMRASSKKFVDVKKVELQLISQSRKVSNSIFSRTSIRRMPSAEGLLPPTKCTWQTRAVWRSAIRRQLLLIRPAATVLTGCSDKVHAEERRVQKTEPYYSTIVLKDSGDTVERIEFMIDIAFVNDFDF